MIVEGPYAVGHTCVVCGGLTGEIAHVTLGATQELWVCTQTCLEELWLRLWERATPEMRKEFEKGERDG